MRQRLSGQSGVTLIEIVVTILVLLTGTLASLSVISSSGKLAAEADRYGVLVSVAQREIEKLRPLDYASLGLNGAVSSNAAEAPLTGVAASEQLISGGVVNPGPEPFTVHGVKGRIYRYVTWRSQTCAVLTDKVIVSLSQNLGQSEADIEAAVGANLCPGAQQTKRVTVVVKVDSPNGLGPRMPYRLSTVVSDHDSTVLSSGNYQGLKVDASSVVQPITGPVSAPATTYAAVESQELYLYDTRCNFSQRQPITASHETRNTALQGSTCGGSGQPDLMGLGAVPGDATTLLYDYSNDITRPAEGGLALLRDSVAGSCDQNFRYSGSESGRKRSLHTWASPPASATTQTAVSGGRATLTFWTRTADGETGAGRLCVAVMRESTGQVIATTDYRMPAWPDAVTQLAVSMDLANVTLAAGERLLLAVRVPSDSGSDLQMLYDHPAYQSNLSLTMKKDGTFS